MTLMAGFRKFWARLWVAIRTEIDNCRDPPLDLFLQICPELVYSSFGKIWARSGSRFAFIFFFQSSWERFLRWLPHPAWTWEVPMLPLAVLHARTSLDWVSDIKSFYVSIHF